MKKTFTLITALYLVATGATAQIVNIPDANFKFILTNNTNINTNQDNEIQVSEAEAFTGTLNCSSQNITDMTGLEAFVNITGLSCNNNQITSLDISQNLALTSLVFGGNQLTSIDLSQHPGLTTIVGNQNQLTSIDVSQNTALADLQVTNNQLTSLDVSQNTALTEFRCGSNQLSSLDLSANTALTLLDCNNNPITSLVVSQNTSLTVLVCLSNQLTNLDVSQNTALTGIQCQNNQITSLDVSQNSALVELFCQNNELTSLNVANGNNTNFTFLWSVGNANLTCIEVDDAVYSTNNWTSGTFNIAAGTSFSENCSAPCTVNIPDANFKASLVGNLTINTNSDTEIQCSEAQAFTGTLDCNSQNISDMTGLEAFVNITGLACNNNQITSLDISQNLALTSLVFGGNQITSIDVSQHTALTLLVGTQNQLTTLDVSQNTALASLQVNNNQLSSLDVSQNTGLTELRCNSNQLSSLDISANTALTLVDCNTNQITNLNVGQNAALTALTCNDNQITSLDVSQCAVLTQLRFQNNALTSLNVANGNNTNFIFFWSVGNANLTCIEVDDAAYSTNNWTTGTFSFDAGTSFSENCSSVDIAEADYQSIDIYPNPTENLVRWDGVNAQNAEVFDNTGRSVLTVAQPKGSIDISDLTDGIYILKLFTEDGAYTTRVVKQ